MDRATGVWHGIQEEIRDEETLFLEYALGAERSTVWAVTSTTVDSFDLPKRSDIETLARRYYD